MRRDKRHISDLVVSLDLSSSNDFLHGNPVTLRNLRIKRSGKSCSFVAPLYRMALACFLDLTWRQQAPDAADGEAQLGDGMAETYQFECY